MDGVFAALRHVAPVAAGFVERYEDGDEASGHVLPFHVPPDYVAGMMLARPRDAGSVLSLVSAAPPGTVLQDRTVLTAEAWREIEGYVALADFGMFHPLALKLSSPQALDDEWQIYVALFVDDPRSPLSPEECHRLTDLQPHILQALRRIQLPFAAEESIFDQIAREQNLGMLCFAPNGRLLAGNGRAWTLAEQVARHQQRPKRDRCQDLVEWLTRNNGPGETITRHSNLDGSSSIIIVSRHHLSKRTHPCGEDLIVFLFREITMQPATKRGEGDRWSKLPPRLRQVAKLLVDTGKPYKLLADDVGVSVGTFRKHVERLFEALQLTSRAELAELARREGY